MIIKVDSAHFKGVFCALIFLTLCSCKFFMIFMIAGSRRNLFLLDGFKTMVFRRTLARTFIKKN